MVRCDSMSSADLKVTVPLAAGEVDDDVLRSTDSAIGRSILDESTVDDNVQVTVDAENNRTPTPGHRPQKNKRRFHSPQTLKPGSVSPSSRSSASGSGEMDNFGETFTGSLEDLVSSFDEKITQCFKNYTENTENIAPVQVRTQEEVMSESQIWWTLTGNFGNILPLDWNKTQARKLQIPALNLQPKKEGEEAACDDLSDEDEELAQALDMHSLIACSTASPHDTPPQTAEQVIEEIDEIMQASSASEWTGSSTYTDRTMESVDSMYSSMKSPMPCFSLARDPELEAKVREAASYASSEQKLQALSYGQLSSLQAELESLIQAYNETLVQELALKDELEFEKELKNTFISLLLSIQNKRRQFLAERKKKQNAPTNGYQPQYFTAVIPYQEGGSPPSNQSLQALIKILRAVNDDNPNVPNMLTDYILNVVCPQANELSAVH